MKFSQLLDNYYNGEKKKIFLYSKDTQDLIEKERAKIQKIKDKIEEIEKKDIDSDKAVLIEKHKREIGRYWASDINSIDKGYLKPEDFFAEKKINKRGRQMIATGEMAETQLEKVFNRMNVDFEYNIKKEMDLRDGITLVVKPDFIFKDFIIETKFPFNLFPLTPAGIPERYKYQLEAEAQAFGLPVYLGVLSVPFDLKLIPYSPSKSRWYKIQNIIAEFHKKLCQIKEEEKI